MLLTLHNIADERRPNLKCSKKPACCIESLIRPLKRFNSSSHCCSHNIWPLVRTLCRSAPDQSPAIWYGVFLVLQTYSFASHYRLGRLNQVSSVSTVVSLQPGRSGFRFPAGPWGFILFKASELGLGPTPPPMQSLRQLLPRGSQKPERQINQISFYIIFHLIRYCTSLNAEVMTSRNKLQANVRFYAIVG